MGMVLLPLLLYLLPRVSLGYRFELAPKGLEKAASWIKDGLLNNGSQFDGGADIQNFANGQTSYTILWAPAQNGIQAKLLEASKVESGRSTIPIRFR